MSPNSASTEPLSLFICYASEDSAYLDELENHLSILVRQGLIKPWSRKNLMAGAVAKSETLHKLETSDIILLMISPDAIASDEFWDTELTIALKRHQKQEVVAIPILLRDVYWKNTQIAALQVLPRNGKFVNSYTERDQVYAHIVSEIPDIVNIIQAKKRERIQYSNYLEDILGFKYTSISPSLKEKLQAFTKDFSLSQQELSEIEGRVLTRNRKRQARLVQYGRFYKENRLKESSQTILRPILNAKLADLDLSENAADVKGMEDAIEREIRQAAERAQRLATQGERPSGISLVQVFENLDLQVVKKVSAAAGVFLSLITFFALIRTWSNPSVVVDPPKPPDDDLPIEPPDRPADEIAAPTAEEAASVVQAYLDAKKYFYARDYSQERSEQLITDIFIASSSDKQGTRDRIARKQQDREYTKFYDQEIEAIDVDSFLSAPGKGYIELKIREVWAVCQTDTDKPVDDIYPRQDITWYNATIKLEDNQWKLDEISRDERTKTENLDSLDLSPKNHPPYKVEFCSDLNV